MDAQTNSGNPYSARRFQEFQRVYKACELCRKKKTRYVLDGAGNPPRPPCLRCLRELKECVFSEERSIRKREVRGRQRSSPQDPSRDDIQPFLSSSLHGDENLSEEVSEPQESNTTTLEHTEAPLSQAMPTQLSISQHNQHEGNASQQSLQLSQHSHRQALPHTTSNRRPSTNREDGLADTVIRTLVSNGNDTLRLLFRAAESRDAESPHYSESMSQPSFTNGDFGTPRKAAIVSNPVKLSSISSPVAQVWNAFRFVKMGWFTAEEGCTYMDLFFKNLASLSPVCQDFDSTHQGHFTLITQEPLLCCTILMISSRYHILPGAGSVSRATLIHQRLWEHCQHLIMRIIFGQEKRSKAKTRTLGAVEALLLMIEWHPKAIHFPPAMDGWDSDLLLSVSDSRDNPLGNHADITDDPSRRWLDDVVAPARMSDRMSWILLGCAQSLAHELGICDISNRSEASTPLQSNDLQRRSRISKLLIIFIEQLSFRLGCTSMVPQSLVRSSFEPSSNSAESAYMSASMSLTNLFRTITDALFPSASGIRQILLSCRYVNVIAHFQQQLLAWKTSHLEDADHKPNLKQELTIEFNHVRIFMNSLGIQAVVDRAQGYGNNLGSVNSLQVSITTTDYGFIQEVIDGSLEILRCAKKLSDAGDLRFCPVRIFLRIIGASILLLKALSLGAQIANLQVSLKILEECVQALYASSLDDMHLASRYAALLELHVARFKDCLVPSSAPAANQASDIYSFDWDTSTGSVAPESSELLPNLAEPANEEWLSLPFNASMAPFGFSNQTFDFSDFDERAWDFLWTLPTI